MNNLALLIIVLIYNFAAIGIAKAHQRELTLDDVLEIKRVEGVVPSPNGELTAIVLQRGVSDGEVYGRTHYEVDPSRNEVWVVGEAGAHHRIAPNAGNGAGFWCPQWSPDGSKLAMLSTQAENDEPTGGDNVRIYVWDRLEQTLKRLLPEAVATQSRYGSWYNRLDVRNPRNSDGKTTVCRDGEENAPFTWLDDDRILAITIPPGQVSTLLDEYSRSSRHAQLTSERIARGRTPTATVSGSGEEKTSWRDPDNNVNLRIHSIAGNVSYVVGRVPKYPFKGGLAVSVSPNNQFLAILATESALPPSTAVAAVPLEDSWHVKKVLGVAAITQPDSLKWINLPARSSLPLELLQWSQDGQNILLRARANASDLSANLFRIDVKSRQINSLGDFPIGDATLSSLYSKPSPAHWLGESHVVAEAPPSSAENNRRDWWLIDRKGKKSNLTSALPSPPTEFIKGPNGALFAVVDGQLMTIRESTKKMQAIFEPSAPKLADIVTTNGPTVLLQGKLASTRSKITILDLLEPNRSFASFEISSNAKLASLSGKKAIFVEQLTTRTVLNMYDFSNGSSRTIYSVEGYDSNISWGRKELISYKDNSGRTMNAVAIMPPNYTDNKKYPVLTWVYPGYTVRDVDTFSVDPYLPGIYNLHLYAAQGYIVLVPTVSRGPVKADDNYFSQITIEVHAALDALITKLSADPNRIAIMGQSNGGFGVYAILSQSDRFKAGIAIAGVSDFSGAFSQFDPTSRGYDGIEHEKSINWAIFQKSTFGAPPYDNFPTYMNRSPIYHVSKIRTPLLIAHGELDIRSPMVQADQLFYMLYSQNKTSKILRYWGENHSVSLSPANVRNLFSETISWLEKYLK